MAKKANAIVVQYPYRGKYVPDKLYSKISNVVGQSPTGSCIMDTTKGLSNHLLFEFDSEVEAVSAYERLQEYHGRFNWLPKFLRTSKFSAILG